MKKHGILIINNNYQLDVPSESEIQSHFPFAGIKLEEEIIEGIPGIHNGKYEVIVLCNKIGNNDHDRLSNAINFQTLKPSIIIVSNKDFKSFPCEDSFYGSSIYVRSDSNLNKNLLLAIDAAFKKYKLAKEVFSLNEQLNQVKMNQNIVDLALSYNSEINNILTAMIGNIQLMMKSSTELDSNAMEKLKKIEKNAQKIQKMALCLIDIINAPSDSVPLNDM